jgi:glycosyltransferase involved in cell wall biosynthesis
MRVAIVIPCRNEEKYIAKCLQSIVDCTYPKSLLQVWVADGRSDDNTRNVIRDFEEKHSWIGLIDNERRTTPIALNLGIKQSPDADVVIILGAHAEIYPDFVDRNVELLKEDPQTGCAGGIIENINEDAASATIALAMSSPFGVGNAHFRTGSKEGYVDTVAFGAYRTDVFRKIGLFDEELARNQDDEFNYRVTKAGYKIKLALNIRSKYYVRASYAKLIRQYYQYGYWKVYVNRKHKTVTSIRQTIPMLFVLYMFTVPLMFLFGMLAGLIWSGGIPVYLLGALYFAAQKSKSPLEILNIVKAFICLHAGYGYGYLKGIVNFILLRRQISESSSKLTR